MLQNRILSLSRVGNVILKGRDVRLNQWNPCIALFASPETIRHYNRKKTIRLPPSKPLNFDYGGDIQKSLLPLDIQAPKPGFEDIQELQEAEAEVQRLFSLEFADGRDVLKKQINTIVEKSKQHPADVKSLEYLISLQTVLIRNQMKHCLEFRKDKIAKSRLVVRIQSRKKKLKTLRNVDYAKFEWLLEELKIKFVSYDPYNYKHYGRHAQRRMAARNKTLAVFKQKHEQLRQELDQERETFEKVKFEELANIEKEFRELGIEPQESLEETVNVLRYGTPKVKKEPLKSRRMQLLEKKFAMWEERKKKLDEENYQKALANL